GQGQRFKEQGVLTPKPLIDIHGHPLYYHSLLSLKPILSQSRVSFVVCTEDDMEARIQEKMKDHSIPFQVISLKRRTKGPAETVFLAKDSIHLEKPLFSLDCDLYFHSPSYFENILSSSNGEHSGFLCYFQSSKPRYSYIKLDDQNRVC